MDYANQRQKYFLRFTSAILILSVLFACSPYTAELAAIDYTPSGGDHRFNLAWGHGGQLILVADDLDMVIVITTDPLYGETGDGPWNHEKTIINLVTDFFASLPSEE